MLTEDNRQIIILASASIARKQILEQAGFSVIVKPTCALEENITIHPGERAVKLSQYKLEIFKSQTTDWKYLPDPVITADTIVICREKVLGKPSGKGKAREMLRQLSGTVHSVYTGFSLMIPGIDKVFSGYESAEVAFYQLNSNDIEKYLHTNEWIEVAGAYKIQGVGVRLISLIKGSYFTIAGLPIHQISGILREQGF